MSRSAAAMTKKPEEARLKLIGKNEGELVLLENLLKIFECPVCWRRSEPEDLIQCRNGHYGCKSCFSRLETCPLCRETLEPEIRTFNDDILTWIRHELRHVEPFVTLRPQDLLRIIKCLSCFHTPTTMPMEQCVNGHIFCLRCSSLRFYCSICQRKSEVQVPFMTNRIRSLAVQELLSAISRPCSFAKHGCPEKIDGFSKHEFTCQYSANYCVMPLCRFKVPLPNLLDHILKDCNSRADYLSEFDLINSSSTAYGSIRIPWAPNDWLSEVEPKCGRMNILKLGEGNYFLFVCEPVLDFSKLDVYTFSFGMPKEAEKYHFTLKFVLEKDGPTIEKRCQVISASDDPILMKLRPNVLSFSFSEIRKALRVNTADLNFLYMVQVFESQND